MNQTILLLFLKENKPPQVALSVQIPLIELLLVVDEKSTLQSLISHFSPNFLDQSFAS